MITLDIDPAEIAAVQERFDAMLSNLDDLRRVTLGDTLADWETQDLNRRKAFVMRSRQRGRVRTFVRPHSVWEMERSARYQRLGGRRIARLLASQRSRKLASAFRRFERKTSMRPILRAGLVERLAERVVEAAQQKLRWSRD